MCLCVLGWGWGWGSIALLPLPLSAVSLWMSHTPGRCFATLDFSTIKGQQLTSIGDFHVGCFITRFLRFRPLAVGPAHQLQSRRAVFFASREGSVGYVAPVTENVFRRLQALQNKLVTAVAHPAGLNPKAYRYVFAFRCCFVGWFFVCRQWKGFGVTHEPDLTQHWGLVGCRTFASEHRLHHDLQRNVLDGDLLWRYLSLDRTHQKDLARQIGSTPDTIIDNLLENDLQCCYF